MGGHVNVPCTSYMIYCHAAKISGIVYYVTCCYAAEISGIVYCVAAMTLKSQKTRPEFFQDFQSSNQHGTLVKSPFFKKTCVLWERFPVRRDVYLCVFVLVYVYLCLSMSIYVYHVYLCLSMFIYVYPSLVLYGGFLKWRYPQISHCRLEFSVALGYPHCKKPPYRYWGVRHLRNIRRHILVVMATLCSTGVPHGTGGWWNPPRYLPVSDKPQIDHRVAWKSLS